MGRQSGNYRDHLHLEKRKVNLGQKHSFIAWLLMINSMLIVNYILLANAARAISLWKCGSISLLPKRLVVNVINKL